MFINTLFSSLCMKQKTTQLMNDKLTELIEQLTQLTTDSINARALHSRVLFMEERIDDALCQTLQAYALPNNPVDTQATEKLVGLAELYDLKLRPALAKAAQFRKEFAEYAREEGKELPRKYEKQVQELRSLARLRIYTSESSSEVSGV